MSKALLYLAALCALTLRGQPPASEPRFDVAAIKLCDPTSPIAQRGGGPPVITPRSLTVNCQRLSGIIFQAYMIFANGRRKVVPPIPFDGAPAWLDSDRYSIEAKSEQDASPEMLQGPMLQLLLEERFQLKLHRATKQVPVYELVVPRAESKLTPFDKSCTPTEPGATGLTAAEEKARGYCRAAMVAQDSTYTVDLPGVSVEQFVRLYLNVSHMADRPVIDKTGISGLFNIHLVFTLEPGQQRSEAVREQIAEVLEKQAGLHLRAATGPSDEFLVIDHIERHPAEN